jgi:hypothetical protein
VKVCAEGLGERLFQVKVTSARSCGEMLLCFTAHHESTDFIRQGEMSLQWIKQRQNELYNSAGHRTYCLRIKDGFSLHQDAEMLVGGPHITTDEDVSGLFQRFTEKALTREKAKIIEHIIPTYTDLSVSEYLARNFHWNGTFSSKITDASHELLFHFDEDKSRQHCIQVSHLDDCCYFEAMVADEAAVNGMSKEKLLRLTWLRNRNIDLVEFLVRPDGCLIGRALHPAASMGFDEFVFTAYVLAVEADRLEYMIKEPDEY